MKQLMTGNEAIARGAWEAGVIFASAYPGTPSTEILENIAEKYKKDIYCEWAPNEKVAMEATIGASVAGGRCMATMKHVGMNVAADPMFTVAYTGVTGGMMIVCADDPGLHSSQNEQDNRHYAKASKIGMLEPSDSQESKDFVRVALELSEQFDTPMMLRMTTRVDHSKSIVELGDRTEVPVIPYVKNNTINPYNKYDTVPAVSRRLHVKVEERLAAMEEYGNKSDALNPIEWNDKKIGVIAAGAAYQYAKEVFGDSASFLKIGLTNPLPMGRIKDFAAQVETLYVIEELDPFMEEQIKAAGIDCIGKAKIPICDELNPDIVREALFGIKPQTIEYDKSVVAGRAPTLCAGCPHRGLFYQLSKMQKANNFVIFGDIGCYGLAGMPPLNAKDASFDMGGGFSVPHGAQKVFDIAGTGKKTVGVMGDSTFFHSGMTSLLNVVYNDSNVLMIILDNRITGMTGHQDNPGTGFNLKGEPANLTNIEEVVKALGAKNVRVINPLHLDEVKEGVLWGLNCDGPAVLITRWPCVLKKLSQMDKEEFGNYKAVNAVDHDKCIGCRSCIGTGCPALSFDAATKKVSIDRTSCVGCDVCVQVCPVGAIAREVK